MKQANEYLYQLERRYRMDDNGDSFGVAYDSRCWVGPSHIKIFHSDA